MIINKFQDISGAYRTVWQFADGTCATFKTFKDPTDSEILELANQYIIQHQYDDDDDNFDFEYGDKEYVIRNFIDFLKNSSKINLTTYRNYINTLDWTEEYILKSFIKSISDYLKSSKKFRSVINTELDALTVLRNLVQQQPEKRINRILFERR
jgi:hypothetical protein